MKNYIARCLVWAFVAACVWSVRADSGSVEFQGQTITFENATTNWVDGELVLKYTDTANVGSLVLPAYVEARMLVVGGGGAGASPGTAANLYGRGGAGGGGAGGFVEKSPQMLVSGTYQITVGAGGTVGVDGTASQGADGRDSSIMLNTTEIAVAKGGGGGGMGTSATLGIGRSGGSGGGGSAYSGTATKVGGTGVKGQGSDGGKGMVTRAGAGGGGAGGVGGVSSRVDQEDIGGDGGAGAPSSISGMLKVYAGGGGGGTHANYTTSAGVAYVGIGGMGGDDVGGNGGYGSVADGQTAPTAGLDGTGSGGGGGCYGKAGAAGGSGVVIIRITRAMPTKPETTATYSYGDIQTIYTNLTPTALTIVYNKTGTTVPAITTEGLGVATHTFTSTLATGCVWSDGSTGAITTTIEISKPTLTVKSLTIEGWQLKDATHDPVLVVTTSTGTEVTLPEENVKFKCRVKGATTWSTAVTKSNWAAYAETLAAATYDLTAEITGTADFNPPSTIPTTTFEIWAATTIVQGLGYSMTLTLSGVQDSGSNKTIPIYLSEGQPSAFHYRHVQPDGSDLRFTDASGNLLPSQVVQWNPNGISLVMVTVPTYRNGSQFKMCWGQLVDTTGADIHVPAAPSVAEPLVHFNFNGNVTNAGTVKPTIINEGTATYVDSGLMAGDKAMRGWSGYANTTLSLPEAYVVECMAKVSPSKNSGGKFNMLWSFGGTSGGFGLLSDAEGNIRFAEWTSNAPYTTLLETKVSDATTSYHRYSVVVTVQNVELLIDGVSIGSKDLSVYRASAYFQFASIYGGVGNVGVVKNTDYSMADWFVAVPCAVAGERLVVAPDACFKNRWITDPVLPAEWGTGQEPALVKLLGDPAYGKALWTIRDLVGNVTTNVFPTEAGKYYLHVETPPGGDVLKTWLGLDGGEREVKVTAHSPTSDLNGSEGSATRTGRVLLVNDFDDGKQQITSQEYGNLSGEIRWVHAGDNPPAGFPNLNEGSVHKLIATSPIGELCGSSNIWTLTDAYIGNTLDNVIPTSDGKRPVYLPTTERNKSHIVMRNLDDAKIASPCYTNGIGTIYFDVVNGTQGSTNSVPPYTFRVEVAEGVWEESERGRMVWRALDMYPLYKDGASAFVAQEKTQHFTPNVTQANSDTRFYRVYVPVNVRGPISFRIVRETYVTDIALDRGGYLLFDNIVVSYPASKVEIGTYGLFDDTKRGESVLGYECAWNNLFPSRHDTHYARAKAIYTMNPGSTKQPEITEATIHYRWRYLNQVYDPEDPTQWKRADFDPKTLTMAQPLDVPAERTGDIEFWYDLVANSPYYSYYDYSGLVDSAGQAYGIGGFYSEEISVWTNRLNDAVAASERPLMPSRGTDWFVRLREGKSDVESFRAIVTTADSNAFATVEFALFDNHLWRGFLPTQEPIPEGLRFRLEQMVPAQVEPDFLLATNRVKLTRDVTQVPATIEYRMDGSVDDWSTLVCDAGTGYLMFQIDDSTRMLTVTHADRQNFNKWNDAHKSYFVGNSTEDEGKSGTSPKIRDYEEKFKNWTNTTAVNKYWTEPFINDAGLFTGWDGHLVFEQFSGATTPNGWTAGPGMWVNEKFKIITDSGAYQMEGRGLGYLEYPSMGTANDPRGVDTISYRARLAQSISFEDIVYNWADGKFDETNVTFAVNVAMSDTGWSKSDSDGKKNDFDGAGQASVFTCFVPKVGCYEFRLTRTDEKMLLVELYKWTTQNGTFTATLLPGCTKIIDRTARGIQNLPIWKYRENANVSSDPWLYSALYISVQTLPNGHKRIQAGFAYDDTQRTIHGSEPSGNYMNICYYDTDPLKNGTCGIASANCPAIFVRPRTWSSSMPWIGNDNTKNAGQILDKAITWPSSSLKLFEIASFKADRWAITDGRYEKLSDDNGNRWGFQATCVKQPLVLQCTNDKGEWVSMGVTNWVEKFTLSTPKVQNFYRVKNARYRLKHAAAYADARFDVVVDELQISQWGGDTYGSSDTVSYRADNDGLGYCTNFVFTSGWVTNHVVQLSAKRTTPGTPCSIRSPLMDGGGLNGARGLGLGMFSFSYNYVDSNVNLLLQVATNNVSAAVLKDLTSSLNDTTQWTTITNFTGTALKATTSDKSRNVYIGLHGVKGVMRIVMDPKVVERAASSSNPNYGRIDITGVFCRDEPALDLACWWGWNLRTVNDDGLLSSLDDGTRMYLPDFGAGVAGATGMSLALNNSTTKDVEPGQSRTYERHMPFLQTPTMSNTVGEVTFRARRIDNNTTGTMAQLCLYGAMSGDPNIEDREWKLLAHFNITNNYYEAYHWRAPSESYHAFRLGVYNVPETPSGTEDEETRYPELATVPPQRVLIEDMIVNEAVYPKLGFRYVYPVRTHMDDGATSSNVVNAVAEPQPEEQPLVDENWTIQAEIEVKQLPEELDLETPGREPRVFIQWYDQEYPWGYARWKKFSQPVELVRAEGEQSVFRGSFSKKPEAVVDESQSVSVVQYSAFVVYYDKGGDVHTNVLSQSEWTRPYWYDPLDYNAGQTDFSAFTIIDRIAPRRVWINEVNVYDGGEDRTITKPADGNQYVEIAVPGGQSLEGWRLDYIDDDYKTNTLCRFGSGTGRVRGEKDGPETNDYVFVVVQSPKTQEAKTWEGVKRPDGQPVVIDGTWDDFNGTGGMLSQNSPIALRLVRPSQVVEQEVALEGYNGWIGTMWENVYTLASYVRDLNAGNPAAHANYYAVGNEIDNEEIVGLKGRSLGVFQNIGRSSNDWNNVMHQTPGWCNEGQVVPEKWVILPNGAMLTITAKLSGPYIRQTFGKGSDTNMTVRVTTAKGGPGTNITYFVDTWYELGSVTTNELPMATLPDWSTLSDKRRAYVVSVGKGCSNNLTVVASARPRSDLETTYGLDPNDPYAPAVMSWLRNGENFFHQKFKNPGEVHLADFYDLGGNFVTNLSLTAMYWLDMDPTEENWRFVAGCSAPKPVAKPVRRSPLSRSLQAIVPDEPPSGITTNGVNIRLTMTMFMTNTASKVSYSPYVLRGVEPDSTSYDHSKNGVGNWESETFKITGDIQNDRPMRQRWVPLRWFYFLPANPSVPYASASFDENHQAVVDVWDPFDENRSGLTTGWEKYKDKPVFYSWAIDTRNMPVTVEPLKPNSKFSE